MLDNSFKYLLDASYEGIGKNKKRDIEGCLSIKDKSGCLRAFSVDRYRKVIVRGIELEVQDGLKLKPFELIATGLYAVIYQHEIDHQMGVLISQIGVEISKEN